MARIVSLVLWLLLAFAAAGCATTRGGTQPAAPNPCPAGTIWSPERPCAAPTDPACPEGEALDPVLRRCAVPSPAERLCPGDLLVPAGRPCPPEPPALQCPQDPRCGPVTAPPPDDGEQARGQTRDRGAARPGPAAPAARDAEQARIRSGLSGCTLGPDQVCADARSMIGRFGKADFWIAAPASIEYDKQFAVTVAVDPGGDAATERMLKRRHPGSLVHRGAGFWDMTMSADLEPNPHFQVVAEPNSAMQPVDRSGPTLWTWTLKAIQPSGGPTPLVAQLRVHVTAPGARQAMLPVSPALEAPVAVTMPMLKQLDLWLNPLKSIYSQLALILGGLWGGISWLRKRLKPAAAPPAADAAPA